MKTERLTGFDRRMQEAERGYHDRVCNAWKRTRKKTEPEETRDSVSTDFNTRMVNAEKRRTDAACNAWKRGRR